MLCAWLAHSWFPGSQGSGIPQAIAARVLRDDADRSHILSLKLVVGKILLTVVGLASGASIGREGPTVQVGASLMLQAARWGGMAHARGLILAGSAAGIAAAFNTPLAGIVFAIEEMGRSYQSRTNGIVLSAVILAGLASIGLVGNYTYFGVTDARVSSAAEWLLVGACGIVGGGMGAGFSWAALRSIRRLRRWLQPDPLRRTLDVCRRRAASRWRRSASSPAARPSAPATTRRAAPSRAMPLPWFFFAEKFAAGLISMISGIPGGIFAPSLSVGAGIGSTLGLLLGADIGLAALLGMAGYFAGVVQAPMTAFVIILEMTGNHDNVIPLMCASMLGYGTARMISREPLYHAMSRLIIADQLRRKRAEAKPAADGAGDAV